MFVAMGTFITLVTVLLITIVFLVTLLVLTAQVLYQMSVRLVFTMQLFNQMVLVRAAKDDQESLLYALETTLQQFYLLMLVMKRL